MRPTQALVATLIVLFVCSNAILAARSPKMSTIVADQRRLLKSDHIIEAENETAAERGFWSTLGKNIKVLYWLETRQADDAVMKKLHLDGLSGPALTAHKNYKFYEKFAKMALDIRLSKRLQKDTSTYRVWTELGFGKLTKASDLAGIIGSDNFQIYARYVTRFDQMKIEYSRASNFRNAVVISREVPEVEMVARTLILAKSKWGEEDVKILLGLTVPGKPGLTLKGDALKKHVDYKYFAEIILKERQRLKNEPLTLKGLERIFGKELTLLQQELGKYK
ncbi:hypothetical protein F441_03595 [Phytophthora nicotianae CJ01A1]|nr:hypothetical protein F441_03595 [Phytophthora nicotianae CJ01A1]